MQCAHALCAGPGEGREGAGRGGAGGREGAGATAPFSRLSSAAPLPPFLRGSEAQAAPRAGCHLPRPRRRPRRRTGPPHGAAVVREAFRGSARPPTGPAVARKPRRRRRRRGVSGVAARLGGVAGPAAGALRAFSAGNAIAGTASLRAGRVWPAALSPPELPPRPQRGAGGGQPLRSPVPLPWALGELAALVSKGAVWRAVTGLYLWRKEFPNLRFASASFMIATFTLK